MRFPLNFLLYTASAGLLGFAGYTFYRAVLEGGPSVYEGKDIRASHAGMRISNPEYDAAIGDLKATLDKLGIKTDEQKELLAIIESTRPQIVEKR